MKKYRSKFGVWNKGKKSPQCGRKGKVPWNKGTKGLFIMEKSSNWRGGKRIDNYGYIQIYIGNNKYITEHRLNMEKFIGRNLKKTEHIHHLNGNKLDNRIRNLIVITNSDHNKIHFPHGWNPKRNIK